jgi:hypothetical protein
MWWLFDGAADATPPVGFAFGRLGRRAGVPPRASIARFSLSRSSIPTDHILALLIEGRMVARVGHCALKVAVEKRFPKSSDDDYLAIGGWLSQKYIAPLPGDIS